jgi:hypothetical protein
MLLRGNNAMKEDFSMGLRKAYQNWMRPVIFYLAIAVLVVVEVAGRVRYLYRL